MLPGGKHDVAGSLVAYTDGLELLVDGGAEQGVAGGVVDELETAGRLVDGVQMVLGVGALHVVDVLEVVALVADQVEVHDAVEGLRQLLVLGGRAGMQGGQRLSDVIGEHHVGGEVRVSGTRFTTGTRRRRAGRAHGASRRGGGRKAHGEDDAGGGAFTRRDGAARSDRGGARRRGAAVCRAGTFEFSKRPPGACARSACAALAHTALRARDWTRPRARGCRAYGAARARPRAAARDTSRFCGARAHSPRRRNGPLPPPAHIRRAHGARRVLLACMGRVEACPPTDACELLSDMTERLSFIDRRRRGAGPTATISPVPCPESGYRQQV
ncbi:peptidoglycan-binding protein LysM [Gracilaria domingensis]|nr:peptidoglycan-binding protein LysM [Gracilaria domingensis]